MYQIEEKNAIENPNYFPKNILTFYAFIGMVRGN